jgi:D-alanine-D-alanine ligase
VIGDQMVKKIRVGLIFGGKSGEHEVSLASAQSVARAIDKDKYEVTLIGITKQGRWIAGAGALKQLASTSPTPLLAPIEEPTTNGKTLNSAELVPTATNEVFGAPPLNAIDVAFPLVHGPFGEDGTLQGLLELADVAYVGAGVAASAVGMDKALMKSIFRANNLPVVDWMVILRRDWELQPEETIRRIESAFGYPCFCQSRFECRRDQSAQLGRTRAGAHDGSAIRPEVDCRASGDQRARNRMQRARQ